MTSIPNFPWKSPLHFRQLPTRHSPFLICRQIIKPVFPLLSKRNVPVSPSGEKTFSLPLLLTSRRMGTNSETCHFSFLRNALCQYGRQLPNIHLVHQPLRYLQPHTTFLVYFPEDSFEMGISSFFDQTFTLPSQDHTSHLLSPERFSILPSTEKTSASVPSSSADQTSFSACDFK